MPFVGIPPRVINYSDSRMIVLFDLSSCCKLLLVLIHTVTVSIPAITSYRHLIHALLYTSKCNYYLCVYCTTCCIYLLFAVLITDYIFSGTTERVCLIMGAADSVRKVHNFIMEKIREKPDPNPKPEMSKNNFERHRQVTVINVSHHSHLPCA